MAFHVPEIIKKHPWAFGLGGVGLFIVIYYLASKSGSSASTGSATDASTLAYDAQQNQLSAAENIAQTNAQAAVQGAQLQANVQSQSIAASQEVTDNQTSASLQAYLANSNNSLTAVQSGNQTSVDLAQVQANEQSNVVNGLASIVNAQYTAQENQQNDVTSYLENLTNTQGAVAMQGLNNQAVATGDQYALDQQVVNTAGPGLNYQISKGNNASQTSAEGVVESLTGNIPGSIASVGGATQTEVNNQNANAASTIGVVQSISSLGGAIAGGLLG